MAAPASSLRAVVSAIAGNGFVTCIKFFAFFVSGSGAMLSEAIHSAADTSNQVLLYFGLRRGTRVADRKFQYGYGGERFVFGLLSASGIFFVGSGVTVYHGIHSLLEPTMPRLSALTFVVLGVSLVIEGAVLIYAARGIARERGELSFWRHVRERADPAAVAILLEDSAAVLGVLLAAAGIWLAYATGIPLFDGLASLCVGLLLGAVAIYLVVENRALLLGRAVPQGIERRFVEALRERGSVGEVHFVQTRQLTPEVFKLKAEVTLEPRYFSSRFEPLLPKEQSALVEPGRGQVLLDLATEASVAIGEEIDRIEEAVRKAIPQATYIDIEIHRPSHVSGASAKSAR